MTTQATLNAMSLGARLQAPTPVFFKKVRTAGIILGTVATALLAAPVALPAIVQTIAGYLVTASIVATAVSATAVDSGFGGNGFDPIVAPVDSLKAGEVSPNQNSGHEQPPAPGSDATHPPKRKKPTARMRKAAAIIEPERRVVDSGEDDDQVPDDLAA